MRCSRFRKLTVVVSRSEGSSRLQQQLDDHQERCPACREFARRMQVVELLLHDLPAEEVPATFADQLRQRLGQVSRRQRGPWYQRLWGELKPPAPIIQPAMGLAAAAIVVLVSVGGVFLHFSQPASSTIPAITATIAELPSDSGAPIWDEVVHRHRQYVLNRPLADDPGMQLISYPLSAE